MAKLYNSILNQSLVNTIQKILEIVTYKDYDFDFLIKFNTKHKDCILPHNLLLQYPKEMTLIIKKEGEMVNFYDFNIGSQSIDLTLSFNNVEERIVICLDSILLFSDQKSDFAVEIKQDKDTLIHQNKNKIIDLDFSKKKDH